MLERLTKKLDVPVLNEFSDEERTITHFISTESVDRDGDIVRSDGGNFKAFKANPVVLWRHDDSEPPIGKNLWLKVSSRDGVKGILAKTQFADTEDAIEIYNLWKGGFLSAASIRFTPTKSVNLSDSPWGPREFVEWDLLEYSIVPIPANADALRLAAKGLKPSTRLVIEKALNDDEQKSVRDMLKVFGETLASLRELLESMQKNAELPETAAENTIKEEEQNAEPAAETLAQEKAYDLMSVVSGIVSGEVSTR